MEPSNPEVNIIENNAQTIELVQNLTPAEYAQFLKRFNRIGADDKLICDILPIIAERFEKDLKSAEEKTKGEKDIAMEIGEETRFALWSLCGNSKNRMSPDLIERFYQQINSESRVVRFHACQYIDSLMIFDNRNTIDNPEQNKRIYERLIEDTANKLTSPVDRSKTETAYWLIDEIWATCPYELNTVLFKSLERDLEPELIKRVIGALSNRLGFENLRKTLKSHAEEKPEFRQKLEEIDKVLNFGKEKVFTRLEELYREISYENYKPSKELLEFETGLLLEDLPTEGVIVNIGCGPDARLTKALEEKGRRVISFDLVAEHIQRAKRANPQLKLMVANWEAIPFDNGSVRACFCLGRSFLHNTTIQAEESFLKEVHRTLDRNGVLILDIPDPEKGHYRKERDKIDAEVKKLGIEYMESGTIIDSPDGQHYFDRLVPTKRQFKAIALLCGFRANIINQQNYSDNEGNVNTNVYWKLTKLTKKLSFDEIMEALHESKTSAPPLYITWI